MLKWLVVTVFIVGVAVAISVLAHNISLQKSQIVQLNNSLQAGSREISQLNSRVSALSSDNERLNLEKEKTYAALLEKSSNLTSLQQKYASLDKNFSLLGTDYSKLREETDNLLASVDEYQKQIQSSLDWYKANSVLGETNPEKATKSRIDSNCYNIIDQACHIKLGCFYLVNREKLELQYEYDLLSSGKADKLSSITEFLANGGGDCEDYSLFYKAEFNYAKQKCKQYPLTIEGWKVSAEGEGEMKYWLNFDETWYLQDVVRLEFKDYIYPNIICGNLYDPVANRLQGHCMIAFSKSEIRSILDLALLGGAYIIEPQDGSFQGNLNQPSSGVYLADMQTIDGNSMLVFTVITDNDFFLFERGNGWQSYASFSNMLSLKEQQLRQLV